jgi:hypothetical protein
MLKHLLWLSTISCVSIAAMEKSTPSLQENQDPFAKSILSSHVDSYEYDACDERSDQEEGDQRFSKHLPLPPFLKQPASASMGKVYLLCDQLLAQPSFKAEINSTSRKRIISFLELHLSPIKACHLLETLLKLETFVFERDAHHTIDLLKHLMDLKRPQIKEFLFHLNIFFKNSQKVKLSQLNTLLRVFKTILPDDRLSLMKLTKQLCQKTNQSDPYHQIALFKSLQKFPQDQRKVFVQALEETFQALPLHDNFHLFVERLVKIPQATAIPALKFLKFFFQNESSISLSTGLIVLDALQENLPSEWEKLFFLNQVYCFQANQWNRHQQAQTFYALSQCLINHGSKVTSLIDYFLETYRPDPYFDTVLLAFSGIPSELLLPAVHTLSNLFPPKQPLNSYAAEHVLFTLRYFPQVEWVELLTTLQPILQNKDDMAKAYILRTMSHLSSKERIQLTKSFALIPEFHRNYHSFKKLYATYETLPASEWDKFTKLLESLVRKGYIHENVSQTRLLKLLNQIETNEVPQAIDQTLKVLQKVNSRQLKITTVLAKVIKVTPEYRAPLCDLLFQVLDKMPKKHWRKTTIQAFTQFAHFQEPLPTTPLQFIDRFFG